MIRIDVRKHQVQRAMLGAVLMTAFLSPGGALAAGPTTEFSLTGAVTHPATYDLGDLQGLPVTVQSVAFLASGVPQSHTYVGVKLWDLFGGDAGIVTNPSVKNDLLRKYVVATGSDGYKSVFALGEISPLFGNRPYMVAYGEQIGGNTVELGSNGFARISVPGDVRGGRYVSNLVNIDVQSSASTQAGIPGAGPASSFTLSGGVQNAGSFTLAALDTFITANPSAAVTKEVTFFAGSTPQTHTYQGVSLWALLNSAGIITTPGVNNDILGKYVVATGSDGYQVVVSLGEIAPNFGNQGDFIAVREKIGDTFQELSTDGFARLAVPGDSRGGRYVSNLIALEVFSAAPVPEPSSAVFLLAGIAMIATLVQRGRGRSRRL